MASRPAVTHRYIHPDHQAAVDRLEARYRHFRLRFDSGFVGSVPAQASGRIGRRFFYFRFRYDTATLTVGSPDRRRDAGYTKAQRVKALRATRRFTGTDVMDRIWAEHGLKPTLHLHRHPSVPVRWAAVHDVTGEPYGGALEQDQAEALFITLMENLEPAREPRLAGPQLRALIRGRRTLPMDHTKGVIAKPANRRR